MGRTSGRRAHHRSSFIWSNFLWYFTYYFHCITIVWLVWQYVSPAAVTSSVLHVMRHDLNPLALWPINLPTSIMPPQRATKVAGEKTTAVPEGISEKDLEVKKSKAMQKQLVPKHTARPAPSQCHILVLNIHSQHSIICANRLLPSLIRSAAVKILNLLLKMRQIMPHCRGTNPNLKIWTLCLILLLVCVLRPSRILTNLVGLLTLLTFSKWV